MKKGLKWTIVVFAALIALGLGGYLWLSNGARDALAAIKYEPVDMSAVADGSYDGQADAGLVFVKVRTTVKNHAIENVEILEHRNGLGSKAESIVNAIVAANSYDVDAVSGATLSSEAIKSAVSRALKEGSK